jgi:hypothetical protein
MTVRERYLAMGVLGFITLAGVGLMVLQFIVSPLRDRKHNMDRLEGEIAEKQAKIFSIQAEKPKMELWRKQSLPADINLARVEYEKFLRELFRQSGFEASSVSVIPKAVDTRNGLLTAPGPGKKESAGTILTFAVDAQGEEGDLVEFLERFYRTPLLHQIKSMNITRPLTPLANPGAPMGFRSPQAAKNELKAVMNIEALVLRDADARNQLLPGIDRPMAGVDVLSTLCNGPGGVALVPWAMGPTGPLGPGVLATPSREYAAIAGKDIFYGPPATEQVLEKLDTLEHVFLTDITYNGRWEAFLYSRYNNAKTRLRASAGFDAFRVRNDKGDTLVQGKVVRIEDRDLIFLSGDKYYSMHVGQNLEEALRHPLAASQLKELGLTASATNGIGK